MNKDTRKQKATYCAFGCENGTLCTLYLADDEVEIHSQQKQGDESEESISEMTVTDLKRLIAAATHLLNATDNDSSLPFSYPVARDII